MKRNLPPYCHRLKGVLYFIRRGWPTRRFENQEVNADFHIEYARILKGMAPPPKGMTFNALTDSYRRSRKFSEKADRTRRDYEKVLTHIDAVLGDKDPRKVQRKHIIKWQEELGGRFGNYFVQVMRILMEHSINIGMRERNPAKGVEMMKLDSIDRQPWPEDLIKAFRAHAKYGTRERLLFELLIGTGQRIGDVLAMKWGDLDGDAVRVRQNKTGQELWLPFTRNLNVALQAAERRSVFILTNYHATGPWSYRGAAQAIRKVRDDIGALDYDIHALRHTTTSELAALGLSDEVIMAVTGHTSVASVRRYSGAARQKARAAEAQGKRK